MIGLLNTSDSNSCRATQRPGPPNYSQAQSIVLKSILRQRRNCLKNIPVACQSPDSGDRFVFATVAILLGMKIAQELRLPFGLPCLLRQTRRFPASLHTRYAHTIRARAQTHESVLVAKHNPPTCSCPRLRLETPPRPTPSQRTSGSRRQSVTASQYQHWKQREHILPRQPAPQ